jgi:hypothetical protein
MAAVVRRFAAAVVSDQHVPGVVVDELAKRGVRNVLVRPWTTQSRTSAFQSLRGRVSTERIEIADDSQLVAELLRVQTRFRGGAATIDVGRAGDSHGDLAVALALAVAELDASGVTRRRARFGRASGGGRIAQGSLGGDNDAEVISRIFNLAPGPRGNTRNIVVSWSVASTWT